MSAGPGLLERQGGGGSSGSDEDEESDEYERDGRRSTVTRGQNLGIGDDRLENQTGKDVDNDGAVATRVNQDPTKVFQTSQDIRNAADDGTLEEQTSEFFDPADNQKTRRERLAEVGQKALNTFVRATEGGDDSSGGGGGGIVPNVNVPNVGISDDWTSTGDTVGKVTVSNNLTSTKGALGHNFVSGDWTTTEGVTGAEGGAVSAFFQGGSELSQGDLLGASNRFGESVLDTVTLGDAQGFREEWREENPEWRQHRANAQAGFQQEGPGWVRVMGTAGGVNEVVRTGLDPIVDSPRGFNVQGATTSTLVDLTAANDREDLAQGTQNFYDGWMQARSAPARFLGLGDSATANVIGTGFDWFVQKPIEETYTLATGIDPQSGETNDRAKPLDLLDVALLGGGKAIKGGTKAAKAAKGGAIGADEAATGAAKSAKSTTGSGATQTGTTQTARAADETRPPTGRSGTASTTTEAGYRAGADGPLTTAAVGIATLLGGARAGRSMAHGFGRIGRTLGRAFGRGARTSDEAADASRAVSTSSIGYSDETLPALTDDFQDIPNIGDDAAPSGGVNTSIDETFNGGSRADNLGISEGLPNLGIGSRTSAAFGSLGDTLRGGDDGFSLFGRGSDETADASRTEFTSTATSGGDESASVASRVRQQVNDVFGSGSDEVADASRTQFTSARRSDEVADATRGPNEGSTLFRTADEGDDTVDLSGALDDAADDAADETATGIARVTGGDGARGAWDNLTSWFGRRSTSFKLGTAFGGVVLADAAARDLFGTTLAPWGGAGETGPGPGDTIYRAEQGPTLTYTDGSDAGNMLKVQKATLEGQSEVSEWSTMGFAILLGQDKRGKVIGSGEWMVLDQTGSITAADPLSTTDAGEPIPQARFGNEGEARQAWQTFLRENSDGTPDDTPTPTPQDHPNITGELTVPDEVAAGEEFSAAWYMEVDGEVSTEQGRIALAIAVPGTDKVGQLAQDEFLLESGANNAPQNLLGGSSSNLADNGTFEVRGGWSVEPGDYDVFAVVYEGGSPAGAVAKTTLTVTGPDGGEGGQGGPGQGDSSDNWGEPQVVRELPEGWYLYGQPHLNRDEVRFMIAAKNKADGSRIYIQPDGRVRESPHFYPSVEKAAQAFRAWIQRHNQGKTDPSSTPSPGAGRPSPEAVARDAANANSGGQAALNGITGYVRRNPAKAAGIGFVGAVAVYWLYDNGYLDGLIRTTKSLNPLA